MYPILLSIGKINFYSYGFFVAMAFIGCYFVMYLIAKKQKLPVDNLLEKLLLVFLVGVIVSRVSFIMLYPQYFSDWQEYFYLWQGGLTSFGGMLGGFIAFIILFWKKLIYWLDIFILGFFAGAVTWRIGCFLTGDHPTVSSTVWYAINNHAPAILFELALSFLGFIILSIIYKHKWLVVGQLMFLGFVWYGLTRIIVDRWRDDPLYFDGNWTGGQIAGLVLVCFGIIGMIVMWARKKG